MLQVMGTKGAPIVSIDFSGEPSGQEGFLKRFQIRRERLCEIKLRMRNQTGVIVDESKEIGFPLLTLMLHTRAMHAVRLPQIVRQFGLEFASILRESLSPVHQTIGSQEAVYRCRSKGDTGRYQPSLVHLTDESGDSGLGKLGS